MENGATVEHWIGYTKDKVGLVPQLYYTYFILIFKISWFQFLNRTCCLKHLLWWGTCRKLLEYLLIFTNLVLDLRLLTLKWTPKCLVFDFISLHWNYLSLKSLQLQISDETFLLFSSSIKVLVKEEKVVKRCFTTSNIFLLGEL